MITIGIGAKGKLVKELQKKLNAQNKTRVDVDGIYGKSTEESVKIFQRSHNLAVDGIAGTEVFKALGIQPNKTPSAINHPLKKFHDSAPLASWIFGGLILIFLMIVVFVDIQPNKFPIIRFLMALSSAFFAFFFVGGVLLEGTLKGLYISATGGFVLFILIQFVFNPFEVLPTATP